MMRFGLRAKLVLWLVGASIAVLVASMFITDQLVRSAMQTEPDWPALGQAVLAQYERRDPEALRAFGEDQHRRGVDVHLFAGDDDLLGHPIPPHLQRYLPQLLAADAPLVLKAGDWQWLGSLPLVTARGEHLKLVALRAPRPPRERRTLFLLSQLVTSVLVIGVLGMLVARSLARPIAGLQQVVRRMADGDLTARTADGIAARSDEIGALARDFDHMAARTETLVRQQRTVLQDVSHELRSPLARLHILLELARQGANADAQAQLQRAEGEITRLDELIGEVLDLSRMEAALPGMALQPLSLSDLLHRLVDSHGIEAEARQLRLQLRLRATPGVQGDAALLLRALGNVLGNAIKFSPAGAAIDISLDTAQGQARVRVRDHGPGVPEGNLATLFQPFYRGDNAALAEGHGLGLAIAQRVIGAHGGSISAANAESGGLCVEIRLPLVG